MMQVETNNNAAAGTPSSTKMMEPRASFPSPESDISSLTSPGSDKNDNSRPSPTKQSCSAVVKVSKMQATFAERTAAEMEEILKWYNKYEGVDRLKKENQQIQFMPHNAMIVVDDDDDNHGEEPENENEDGKNTEEEDQGQEIQVDDDEFVMVKDYHTPSQKNKTTTPSPSFQKKTASLLVSTVRSITKAHKKHDPPPIAIKLSSEDEEDAVVSPLPSKLNADDSMKEIHPPSTVTISSMHEDSTEQELMEYRDQEEEVLAMLSPCAQPKAPILITKPDDDEEELMELLLSPTSCSSKSVSSFGGRKSPVSDGNDSLSERSTCEEAQSQIKAADDLIRNTQNMAEIIAQLQQSSLLSFSEDDGDDNIAKSKINETSDDISNPTSSFRNDDFETFQTPVTKTGMRNRFNKPRIRDRRHSNASIASMKVRTKNNFSRFLGRQLDRFVMSIVLSLAVGLVLKFIIA